MLDDTNMASSVVFCFHADCKILYMKPRFRMVRNKYQEDNDLEAMISSFELQEGLNQRSA